MNRFFLLLAVFLISSTGVLAASVVRDIPSSASQGETVSVILIVQNFYRGGDVVIGELLPKGAKMVNWSVIGAQELREDISFTTDGRSYVWRFTANTPNPWVMYTVTLPPSDEAASFDMVYALSPNEVGRVVDTVILGSGASVVAEEPALTPTGAFLGFSFDSTAITGGFVVVLIFMIIIGTLQRSHPNRATAPQISSLPGEYVWEHFAAQERKTRVHPPHESPRYGPSVHEFTGVRPRPSVYPFTYTSIAPLRDDATSQKK